MHANEIQKGDIKIECGRGNKSGPRPGNHPDIHANEKGKWKCGWGNTQKNYRRASRAGLSGSRSGPRQEIVHARKRQNQKGKQKPECG